MRFNLIHVISAERANHGLHGYREVIETVRWGLEALGHEVGVTTNGMTPEAVNIVFGFQMLHEEHLRALPDDSIIYNLEQVAGAKTGELKPQAALVAERLQVWDYNQENLATWELYRPARRPIYVPIGYAPVLKRIAAKPDPYIDVLFYGYPSAPRMRTIHEICGHGMHCVFACGLYGEQRDELIGRSKVMLNLNRLNQAGVFEIVRVSYLLANGKAVVSDLHPGSLMEPDMLEAVAFAPPEKIAETCWGLVSNESARRELERRGREIFERRDIRAILSRALDAGQ
jgi:hypothetical protein